ncbi:hypothetical protein FQR65_LT12300 [Abscondita terminalis]|nr:hypothetical protein FQR65_LT12300 [Abscondita terminalis]
MSLKKTVLLFLCVASNYGDEDQKLFSKFFQHDYDVKDIRLGDFDYNKKLIHEMSFDYKKYNRTTKAVNITCFTRVDLTMTNTLGFAQSYRRYGNEFKEFPARLSFKLCLAVQNNVAGIATSTTTNFSCPIKKNVRYTIHNWIPDVSRLPPFIPDGEYMLHVNVTYEKQYLYYFNAFGTVYRHVKLPK